MIRDGLGSDRSPRRGDGAHLGAAWSVIRLTAAGVALLPEARRLLADVHRTLRSVRRVAQGAVGRLTVGFVPSVANGCLPRRCRPIVSAHPGVELRPLHCPPASSPFPRFHRLAEQSVLVDGFLRCRPNTPSR